MPAGAAGILSVEPPRFGVPPTVHEFIYRYDFGDDWVHDIRVEGRISVPDIPEYPICTGGARSGPPEDCGRPDGYEELLKILANRRHREHVAMKRWVGDIFDPDHFDRAEVNEALMDMRPKRRQAGSEAG